MTRRTIILALVLAVTGVAHAQPMPEQLNWRSTMLGMGWRLYRGSRLTGFTIAQDQQAGVWRLYRDGVLVSQDPSPEPLKAIGSAGAPP